MIIIGVPNADELSNYYMADEDVAFILEQSGFHARYIDGCVQYFKLNKKLKKKLLELDIEL